MEKAKKRRGGWIILLILILIIAAIFILGWQNGISPGELITEFPDSLGMVFPNFPLGGTSNKPGTPVFSQFVLDCRTGDIVMPGEPIQPYPGCDSWEFNRYERPFNADSQDEYYPDLDILYADLGQADGWFYLRIALYDPRPGSDYLEGVYAFEVDLDEDRAGDILVLVSAPGKESGSNWSKLGVQIWKDSNDDVGYSVHKSPEDAAGANGYDTLVYDSGDGEDTNAAFARVFMTGSAYVEIAFKEHILEGAKTFKWWVWSDNALKDPSLFDFHDMFSHEKAGDPGEYQPFYPSKDLYAMDNTCAEYWGGIPEEKDPDLCDNDEVISKQKPTLVFLRPTLVYITPTYTATLVNTPTLVGTPTPTPLDWGTTTPTWVFTDTPTLVATATPTIGIPTFTPTEVIWVPTATKVCKPGMYKAQCLASGGIWVENVGKPSYCYCP